MNEFTLVVHVLEKCKILAFSCDRNSKCIVVVRNAYVLGSRLRLYVSIDLEGLSRTASHLLDGSVYVCVCVCVRERARVSMHV